MKKITLYPNQEAAVQRMMAEPTKSILLAHEQDQGKSVQSIEFALRMGFKRVLFVGIKDTFEQFKLRAEAQSDGTQTIRNIDSKAEGKKAQADLEWGVPGWYFIGSQLLVSRDWATVANAQGQKFRKRLKTWDELQLDLIVFDEVHMVSKYRNNGQMTLHNLHSEWKVAMSGTFYGNKFENCWAPAYWLWPDQIDASFHRWKLQNVEQEPVLKRNGHQMLTAEGEAMLKAGKTLDQVPEYMKLSISKGEIPPEGRFVASLPCYIRHVGAEDVPEPKIIEVDLLPEQRRMYDALEADLLVWIRKRAFVVDASVTLKGRLRTAALAAFDFEVKQDKNGDDKDDIFFHEDAESTKIDALLVEIAQYPTERVVLGTHSKKFAKLVVARMKSAGLNVAEWSGDVSSSGRQAIKEAWLADELQYIVCVIKSFSTGLDWAQTNCWRMGVLSEQEGDPTAMGQWVRRVFRTGPHKDKFEWFSIQARNTWDTGVFNNLQLQQEVQRATLGKTA